MNKYNNILTILTLNFIFLFIFSAFAFSNDFFTAEGSIKYIGKPTFYNKPFILLSSLQRFYITNELYNKLLQTNYKNKYYFLVIKDNVVNNLYNIPFKGYKYLFPPIKEIRKFNFKKYTAYYIIWYYNFSPYVNIYCENNRVSLFYTSPNSLTLKIPYEQKVNNIILKAVYKNSNILQVHKYSIQLLK